MAGELVPNRSNALLERVFRDRKAHWSNLFATADISTLRAIQPVVISELDEFWRTKGLMNQDCLVSGEGTWTATLPEHELTDEDQDNIMVALPKLGQYTVIRSGIINRMRAYSRGFNVTAFDGAERPSLSYHFVQLEGYGVSGKVYKASIEHHAQIKLGTLSLLPLQAAREQLAPISERFVPLAANN